MAVKKEDIKAYLDCIIVRVGIAQISLNDEDLPHAIKSLNKGIQELQEARFFLEIYKEQQRK